MITAQAPTQRSSEPVMPFPRRLVDDVLDRMTDGVWAIDRDWRFTYVNARAARRFGRPSHELVGQLLPELFPQVMVSVFARHYRMAFETQQPVQFEARSELEDQWTRVRVHPSPDGITVFFEDITAERQAVAETRRLHEVLDATQDLVLLSDTAGRIIHLNPAARRALAIPETLDISALTILDFFPLRVRGFLTNEGLPALLAGASWRGAMPVVTHDGRELTADIVANVHKDADGVPQYLSAIVRDMTAERMQQQRLERHARQQAKVAELGMLALGALDVCALVASALEMTSQLIDATGVAYLDVLPGGAEAVWRQSVGSLAEIPAGTVTALDDAEHAERPSGRPSDRPCAAVPVRGRARLHGLLRVQCGDGAPPAPEDLALLRLVANVIASAIERAEAERSLTHARDFYFTLFDAFPTLNWRADIHGARDYFNNTWLAFTGRDLDTELGSGWLEAVHPNDRERVRTQVAAASRARAPWEMEYRLQHHDGSWRWILEHGGPYREIDGGAGGFVGSCTDVTEQRTLAEELRQALRLEAVGRLAGGVAHDFNNLITTIKGHGQLALDDLQDQPEIAESVQEMIGAADRGASLTRQLLLFSRREITQPQPVLINDRVAEFERLMRRVLPESIDLDLQLASDTLRVLADPGQLDQVLMNLVVNARDAIGTSGGRIRIGTSLLRVDRPSAGLPPTVAPGNWIRLCVEDNGAGMDADTLARIFEPFFTTKPQGEGTGLGLSTVYGIIKQAGGSVFADSTPGKGSRFTILIPESRADAAPGPSALPERAHSAGHETVLVVEDEPAVRELVRRTLERQGYRVLIAVDGIEALTMAESHGGPIDLVLSDVVMPRLNGPEALQRLRVSQPGIRSLLMSGYATDTISAETLQRDGLRLLEKPFSPTMLITEVRRVLDA